MPAFSSSPVVKRSEGAGLAILFALLLGFAPPLGAQVIGEAVTSLPPQGARVRVEAANAQTPIVGKLESIRSDTLVIREDMSASPRLLATGDVSRMQVLRRAPTAGRNSAIGGLLGAVAGGGWYLAWCSDNRDACRRDAEYDPDPYDDEPAMLTVATVSIIGGALIGGGLAYILTPREWTDVQTPLRLGVAPTARGGLALTGSVSFR